MRIEFGWLVSVHPACLPQQPCVEGNNLPYLGSSPLVVMLCSPSMQTLEPSLHVAVRCWDCWAGTQVWVLPTSLLQLWYCVLCCGWNWQTAKALVGWFVEAVAGTGRLLRLWFVCLLSTLGKRECVFVYGLPRPCYFGSCLSPSPSIAPAPKQNKKTTTTNNTKKEQQTKHSHNNKKQHTPNSLQTKTNSKPTDG